MKLVARLHLLVVIAYMLMPHFAQAMTYNPGNTLILWDLNGVILKADPKAMIASAWHCNHKFEIIKNLLSTCFHVARDLTKRPTTFEEFIRTCEICNPHLAKLMRIMSSCHQLSQATITIIESLYAKGYTLALATNMGIKTVDLVKQKYEQFFDYFSVTTTPDTIEPSGQFIKKPDIRFFELYQKFHNKEGKYIIFIDDTQANVTIAQQAGMQTILFKNPKQLRCDLQKLKLIPVL
jgi:FMN phosphatase YigB (HAD superfamily)